MKLSTKSRYGLKAVYVLGNAYNDKEIVTLATLSKHILVGSSYIEQILRLLKKDGIVESVRGATGGYTLTKHPKEITIGEILRSLEDGLELVDCIADGSCHDDCPTRKIWVTIYNSINDTLDKITLEQMLEENSESHGKDIFGSCSNNIR